MKTKSFEVKSKIDKKLCINCKHCLIFYSLGGMGDRIMCGFYRDKVDDSEIYSAFRSRYSPWLCGGRKWEIKPEIVICKSEEEANFLRSEQFIEGFLPLARQVVRGEVKKPQFTCGGYEEAIKRAKEEAS